MPPRRRQNASSNQRNARGPPHRNAPGNANVADGNEAEGQQAAAAAPAAAGVEERAVEEEIDDMLYGGFGDDVEEEDEGEGEELFGDNFEADYRHIPELDVYEREGIDDNAEQAELTAEARRLAERTMLRRDVREGVVDQRDLVFGADLDDELELEDAKGRRYRMEKEDDEDVEEAFDEMLERVEETRGFTAAEWLQFPATRNEMRQRFMLFLHRFRDANGEAVYKDRIVQMCQKNESGFEVSFQHLHEQEPTVAFFLPEAPLQVFPILDEAATRYTLKMYPLYGRIAPNISVRIADTSLDMSLRSLRTEHLNHLVEVEGVVSSSSGVMPELAVFQFRCGKCGLKTAPIVREGDTSKDVARPALCEQCESKGPFEIDAEEAVYRNYQRIMLQEKPSVTEAGRLPRAKDVILTGGLVDSVRPGDEITLVATYMHSYDTSLNIRTGFPVFSTILLANNVLKRDDRATLINLTDDDMAKIQRLAQERNIDEMIFQSIAPSIYGHMEIKRAIAVALFGGQEKQGAKHRIRGDINVLLCGDPGTAKSQFLKAIKRLASRAVYTTGQGASAVGLTAFVNRHPISREWTLEAGAMVLADRGVCLIDEFDKMNEVDRSSIHEAMEQQSISIAKAGITTSLQARCAVIAAANPLGGHYDPNLTFHENVDLSEPILSRFDLLCVVRDEMDENVDTRQAHFVVRSHRYNHPERQLRVAANQKPDDEDDLLADGEFIESMNTPIPTELLRKYIIFAREKYQPKLGNMDQEKVAAMYAQMRRESLATSSIPITVRHVESVVRLSEAHARMHLRNLVNEDDVNFAVATMLESFLKTQKLTVQMKMRSRFSRFLQYKRRTDDLLLFMLRQAMNDELRRVQERVRSGQEPPQYLSISLKQFVSNAQTVNPKQIETFVASASFRNNGYIYDELRGVIRKPLS